MICRNQVPGRFQPSAPAAGERKPPTDAFTLLELLVIIAVISLLATILVPATRKAHGKARQALCRGQQRQLVIANLAYANDHATFVPAAPDLFGANRIRWHGIRDNASQPFEGSHGALAPYLGEARQVRVCPTLNGLVRKNSALGFEAACGGYGYNAVGIGSQAYLYGFNASALSAAMDPISIGPPARTLMFCDTALPQPYGSPDHLIEYSFAEPYFFIEWDRPEESASRATPSIHFRHGGAANVAWADGHISSEARAAPPKVDAEEFDVGWFGEPGNAFFDLK